MRMQSCFICIFSCLIAAMSAQADPTADYLAARDQYITAFKNLPDKDQNGPQAKQSRAHVEQLLTRAIQPWSAPGFPPHGAMNRFCFDDDALGFSVPNGLIYSTQTTTVFVTNRALLQDWLRKNNKVSATQAQIAFPAVFSDEELWTVTVGCDSGADLRKMIDIPRPAGADSVAAALVEFSTGGGLISTPDTVVAAVVRGDRIFMASTKLTEPLPADPDCKKTQARREKELLSGPSPQYARSDAAVSYQVCFDKNLAHRPVYAKVQKQAQALANILH